MVIFHCYVSLPEGKPWRLAMLYHIQTHSPIQHLTFGWSLLVKNISKKRKNIYFWPVEPSQKKGPFWPSSHKSPWLQPSIFVFSDLFMKELVVLQVLITEVVFHLPITGDIPGSSYHLPHRDITGILETSPSGLSHKPWVKTVSCRHAHPHPQTETITPKYEATP